jgi:hypothetical protein
MSAISATPSVPIPRPTRSAVAASRVAFAALLLRDLTVLKKNLGVFIARTLIQPFLLVFVFLYVFPQIGEGTGCRVDGAFEDGSVDSGGVVLVGDVQANEPRVRATSMIKPTIINIRLLIFFFLPLFHIFISKGIQIFIETLHAQPAANVDKIEQIFTAYHADDFAILDYGQLVNIFLG